ncbi:hypothetical protein QQ020_14315 [Fulvivirgaceae bacterium BMA12]|uniref:Uncharacterized protein n=1 Tax=Agaribacillus aureus TaxID=3051825 RepID=A0ABT8L679_9BACT|nr:hypothetical protein [Fulvivirgaceae bacterium BMA12]
MNIYILDPILPLLIAGLWLATQYPKPPAARQDKMNGDIIRGTLGVVNTRH